MQMTGGRGIPPFQIRNASEINANLNVKAAPDGFINFPIYTYIEEGLWLNDLDWDNCNYVATEYAARVNNESIYTDYLPLKANLTTAFGNDGFVNDQNVSLTADDFTAMTYQKM